MITIKSFLGIAAFMLILPLVGCRAQETVSTKKFTDISMVNRIIFSDNKFDQPKFSCSFLLAFNGDTVAVTAKHLLKIIKTDDMKSVSFGNELKSWTMFPLDKPNEVVTVNDLLNENKSESLKDKSTYHNDWLVFSIRSNQSNIVPLKLRVNSLKPGEKLYVVGWTRKMEEGGQRVYEFEYHKKIGNRLLLKTIIAPELMGGLSGAPVVDANGEIVALVSNGTVDPEDNVKYFSPCGLEELKTFLSDRQKK